MTTKEKELKRLKDLKEDQKLNFSKAYDTVSQSLQKTMEGRNPWRIISDLSQAYNLDYPLYKRKRMGEDMKFFSGYEGIKNLGFETEYEVILANAIYNSILERDDEEFNPNDFLHMIKPIWRILGIKSAWSE